MGETLRARVKSRSSYTKKMVEQSSVISSSVVSGSVLSNPATSGSRILNGSQGLSIGQVSEATGLGVHALRFFEREGLFLREVPRTGGGQRVYDSADVEWLKLCNRFRESGMPIATVKEFARLV